MMLWWDPLAAEAECSCSWGLKASLNQSRQSVASSVFPVWDDWGISCMSFFWGVDLVAFWARPSSRVCLSSSCSPEKSPLSDLVASHHPSWDVQLIWGGICVAGYEWESYRTLASCWRWTSPTRLVGNYRMAINVSWKGIQKCNGRQLQLVSNLTFSQ